MTPSDSHAVPPPLAPKLERWLSLNRIAYAEAGRRLGVSGEAVRKWCLPFESAVRQVPSPSIMERIVAWTAGAIQPADFYPPHLSDPPPRLDTRVDQ